MEKQSVLVSACLLGLNCRYDGSGKLLEGIERLKNICHIVPVCPEQLGGMKTPREPSERMRAFSEQGTEKRCIMTCSGEDVTWHFEKGALEACKLAGLLGCSLALLKERSPSCGHGLIYDGTFGGKLTEGNGAAAELLALAGVCIYGESELDALCDRLKRELEESA